MNIILFDDSVQFRKDFNKLAIEYGYSLKLSTGDAEAVKRYVLKQNEPTLFFIDIVINRNHKAGMNLADFIIDTNKNNSIVFITDYPNLILYNTHSKMQAKNIILKNEKYFKSEFLNTVKKMEAYYGDIPYFKYYSKCDGVGAIAFDDIYFLEKLKGSRTIMIHKQRGVILIQGSFVGIENQLDSRFIRCHNSTIVNKEKMIRLLKKENKIVLDANKMCFYSRGKKKVVEECFL